MERESESEYVSEIYRIPTSVYVKAVMRRWIARYAWIFALIVVGLLILAATVNSAFVYVALMTIFIIFPMAMTFVYFHYGMSPEGIDSTRPQRFRLTPTTLTIEYLPFPNPTDGSECTEISECSECSERSENSDNSEGPEISECTENSENSKCSKSSERSEKSNISGDLHSLKGLVASNFLSGSGASGDAIIKTRTIPLATIKEIIAAPPYQLLILSNSPILSIPQTLFPSDLGNQGLTERLRKS